MTVCTVHTNCQILYTVYTMIVITLNSLCIWPLWAMQEFFMAVLYFYTTVHQYDDVP